MGKDVAESFPEAREVFAAVDDALDFALSRLMSDGPESELTLTHNAQPAILTHTLAVYAVIRRVLRPVAGAGHSLGEYSAYVAADALDAMDAARLVRRRGELMYEAGTRRPGTMAAVIGLDAERVTDLCRATSSDASLVVAANINAPDQTVISGDPDAVERAATALRDAGAKRVLPLKVSGAFHSPLMEPAELGLREELLHVGFRDPTFPVIANTTAEPVTGSRDAHRLLGEQLTAPVRWAESMERAAADAGPDPSFVEIGPGSVLGGLVRRNVSGARSVSVGNATQLNGFMEEHA